MNLTSPGRRLRNSNLGFYALKILTKSTRLWINYAYSWVFLFVPWISFQQLQTSWTKLIKAMRMPSKKLWSWHIHGGKTITEKLAHSHFFYFWTLNLKEDWESVSWLEGSVVKKSIVNCTKSACGVDAYMITVSQSKFLDWVPVSFPHLARQKGVFILKFNIQLCDWFENNIPSFYVLRHLIPLEHSLYIFFAPASFITGR